jgi:L,D-transpeptidase catalytic domain
MNHSIIKSVVGRLLAGAALAAVALTFSNCKTRTVAATGSANYSIHYDPPAQRPSNPSDVRAKISTGAQRLYVMEGSKVLLATPCSVGRAGTPTPGGNHRIYSKQAKRRSHSYGNYPMPYWCEFQPAYGIHWGYVKPYPCTHGCVRLPKMAAAKFFALIHEGTPLNVAHSQPEDATIGATLPVLDDTTLPDPPNSYMMSERVFQDAVYTGKMFAD